VQIGEERWALQQKNHDSGETDGGEPRVTKKIGAFRWILCDQHSRPLASRNSAQHHHSYTAALARPSKADLRPHVRLVQSGRWLHHRTSIIFSAFHHLAEFRQAGLIRCDYSDLLLALKALPTSHPLLALLHDAPDFQTEAGALTLRATLAP
jgi:hypothetical protein